LDVESVKRWDGESYDAIFLAGNWEGNEAASVDAASVYARTLASMSMMDGERKINENCLASNDKCEIARSLLEKMVVCVCKSFVDKLGHNDGWLSKASCGSMIAPLKELNKEKNVLVPITKEGTTCNVRKISFSHYTDVDNNPAPDPVLLLA
jgi:hypothetical protein